MKAIVLDVEVLRPANGSDCTLDGVSSRFNRLRLLIPNSLPEEAKAIGGRWTLVEDITPGDDLVVLRRKVVFGKVYYNVAPFGEKRWCMFGSNFVYLSGNGFRDLTGYPIPIHDRIEEKTIIPSVADLQEEAEALGWDD